MIIHVGNFDSFFPNTMAFVSFKKYSMPGKPILKKAQKRQLGIDSSFHVVDYYNMEDIVLLCELAIKHMEKNEKSHLYISSWKKLLEMAKKYQESD